MRLFCLPAGQQWMAGGGGFLGVKVEGVRADRGSEGGGTAAIAVAIHARTTATQPRSRTDSNVNTKMVMESYVMRGGKAKQGRGNSQGTQKKCLRAFWTWLNNECQA